MLEKRTQGLDSLLRKQIKLRKFRLGIQLPKKAQGCVRWVLDSHSPVSAQAVSPSIVLGSFARSVEGLEM